MFSFQSDMMMIEFLSALRRRMPELETLDSMDCPECSGPPPIFRLPPPPRPPFLTEASFCSEAPLAELEDCIAIPMIDASYHANPSLQNTALIITCAVILLLMAAIVSVVFWKHKRKVQNLLPCKSAAAAAAASRGRVLTNGQPLPITGTAATVVAGNTLLYEDLMENPALSQNHQYNHHMSIQPGIQSTIEVRDTITSRQLVNEVSELTSTPQHLDYLDYRDPRSILCVSKKPSRAVLGGGYRTPQALLAKSKSRGVTSSPITRLRNQNLIDNNNWRFSNSCSPNSRLIILPNDNNLVNNSHRISQLSSLSVPISEYNNSNVTRAFSTMSNVTIAPTHQTRVVANASKFNNHELSYVEQMTREELNNDNHGELVANVAKQMGDNDIRRRSIDSEGYAYVDFGNEILNKIDNGTISNRERELESRDIDLSRQRLLERDVIHRDPILADTEEPYTYIDSIYSRPTNSLRRNFVDGTDEEVCPLCTMQQIHYLLAKPNHNHTTS